MNTLMLRRALASVSLAALAACSLQTSSSATLNVTGPTGISTINANGRTLEVHDLELSLDGKVLGSVEVGDSVEIRTEGSDFAVFVNGVEQVLPAELSEE